MPESILSGSMDSGADAPADSTNMTDVGTPAGDSSTIPPSPTQPPQTDTGGGSASFLDSEGNFTDNWKSSLPEELRNEAALSSVKSLKGLTQAYIDTKKMVGSRQAQIPDQLTEDQWGKIYSIKGRPESADSYEIKRNENIPEDISKAENLEPFKKLFHKFGLNQNEVNEIIEVYDRQTLQSIDDFQGRQSQSMEAQINELKSEWGGEFQANVNKASFAYHQLDPDGTLEKAGLGNSPAVIKFCAKVADLIGGDKFISSDSPGSSSASIESEMVQIQSNPAYRDRRHPEHEMLVSRYGALAQQRSKMRG